MSNLSPDQFRDFVHASDAHLDSTYPSWRGGEPMKVLAEATVKKTYPYRQITSIRKDRLN